jgi:hypothetical protein
LNRRLLVIAIAGNCAVILGCVLLWGWTLAGAGAAARNTARLSVLFFLVGFASPGLRRWIANLPGAAAFFYAFVAAHFVHFGAVLMLHLGFGDGHVTLPQIVVVVGGVTITSLVALTAAPRPQSRPYKALHLFAIYTIFLILAADYSQHPIKSMRLMAIPVVAALVLRHLPKRAAEVAPAVS